MTAPTRGITVLCPTRDRPANAKRLRESFMDTKVLPTTELVLVLDVASQYTNDYVNIGGGATIERGNMVQRTNTAALNLAHRANILGWAADDNLFVTPGWDKAVTRSFGDSTIGMVNTNDLLVGNDKAGAFFMRTKCVLALRYMFLPTLAHLYADFAASELFKAAGAYIYREDVVIEHLHPYAGKAPWDDAYLKYNTTLQDDTDRAAFWNWRLSNVFDADKGKVMECLDLS